MSNYNEFDTSADAVFDTEPAQQYNNQPQIGMKWHKFLIYFGLWLSALSYLGLAFSVMTGAHYGGSVELVARRFPGVRVVDIIYGICLLALAVGVIIARFRLAKFDWNGVKMLKIFYVAPVVLSVLYAILASATTGLALSEMLDTQTLISNIASCVIGLWVANVYYGKRKFLFHN